MVTVTLDAAGRVVLPKRIREEMNLAPGDTFTVACDGESLTLRRQATGAPLRKKQGIWVFGTGVAMTQDESASALRQLRESRDRAVARAGLAGGGARRHHASGCVVR